MKTKITERSKFHGNQHVKVLKYKDIGEKIGKIRGCCGCVKDCMEICEGFMYDGYTIGENTKKVIKEKVVDKASTTIGTTLGNTIIPGPGGFVGGFIGGLYLIF